MTLFTGAGVAIVTPFDEKLGVNYERLEELINFQIENGTDAIIICGTTGEASTLTEEEHIECIRFTAKVVNKRVPVIAGTGSNCTLDAIMYSQEAEKAGADGLLVVTPYYNKATQKGLIRYFSDIANAVSIPLIMYNVPSRTGCSIAPKTALELSKIDNIVGIKEASGNLDYLMELAHLCKDKLDIYSGNDDMVVPLLSLGGKGVISVLSNVMPRETHEMVQKYLTGDVKGSLELQLKLLPLVKALFCEVNPIPVKKALNLMGMNVGSLRLPLTELDEQFVPNLAKAMTDMDIKIQ